MDKSAVTEYPLMPELQRRWSPRAFDPDYRLSDEEVRTLFEAARWSASASNTQPWRYAAGHRGDQVFQTIHQHLASGNQVWAGAVSMLVAGIAEEVTEAGKNQLWAQYDLGQAAAHLSIQATHMGLMVHQMGGFKRDELRVALGLEDRFTVVAIMAIGRMGDISALPENLREREVEARDRKPLAEIMLSGL